MTDLLATIRRLSVAYGDVDVVRGLSFDIRLGERLAIIGESGSGKSTFARALAGLLPPRASLSGEMDWPGFGRPPLPGRDLGFVFQDPGSSLNPVLTIGEQIAEGARRHLGYSASEAWHRARELAGRVRLPQPETILNAFPHQLSGGQKQRVAIAAAIASRPRFLIADEVTSALDMVVQAEIVSLLRRLVAEDGMTLLFITHDIALASAFADRIVVFRNGELVEIGAVKAVVSRPADAYTAELIAGHIDFTTPRLVEDMP